MLYEAYVMAEYDLDTHTWTIQPLYIKKNRHMQEIALQFYIILTSTKLLS
jgi:hypothetical protein